MITRLRAIAGKIEGTEGTYETLAAADGGLLLYDAKFITPEQWVERNPMRATFSRYPGVHGRKPASITFRVEVRGSGTAGTAPDWGKYLRACGFGETVVGGVSVTYKPISTAIPCLSMALWDDGVAHRIRSARGNVKLSAKIGEPAYLDFEFSGVYQAVVDEATPGGISYSSVQPVACIGANILTMHTYNPIMGAIDIDMGTSVAVRESMNVVGGLLSALITGRDPKGTLDPEMTTVAAHDWYGKWASGVTGTLSFALTGSAGNITTITAPTLQYRAISDAERNGISARAVGFSLAMNAGDDELVIALT